jgi:ribonuclease Z
MKLFELKDLTKKLGGKPGTLRKSELIALCQQLLLDTDISEEFKSEVKKDEEIIGIKTIVKKKTVRSLVPISTNSPSFAENQIPGVKGDIGTVGVDILQELSEKLSVQSVPVSNSLDNSDIEEPSEGQGEDETEEVRGKSELNEIKKVDNLTREYEFGVSNTSSGSMQVLNTTSGKLYWSRHPTGYARDERLLEGPQQVDGFTVGGKGSGMGDMDMTFLGTASCTPSNTRGVSAITYRYNSDVWLFDCGESTQLQLQNSRIRLSKIKKIFITHAHGDHSFGLPGVLCQIGQSTQDERQRERDENRSNPNHVWGVQNSDSNNIIDIYGPEGTRDLVRAVIQLTYSKIAMPHRIHELKNVEYLHGKVQRYPPVMPTIRTRAEARYGEQPGGTDIYPDANGHYNLVEEGELSVKAAPMQHTIPCVGFVVSEKPKAGRLKFDDVKHIVQRNRDEIKRIFKLDDANKILKVLKNLKPGQSLTFPDGTVVNAEDVVDLPRPGRKVVLMGDTCSGDRMVDLAMDADVLVHEATNAWIREHDYPKHPSPDHLQRETFKHGHSTPEMAARFATRINAKKLVLTHFSSRYRGDTSDHSMKIMWRIEHMARKEGNLWGKNDVIAAWDQMNFPIRSREQEDDIRKKENQYRAEIDLQYSMREKITEGKDSLFSISQLLLLSLQ